MGFPRAEWADQSVCPRLIKQFGRPALETVPGQQESGACEPAQALGAEKSPEQPECEPQSPRDLTRPLLARIPASAFSRVFAKRAPSPPAQPGERSGPLGAFSPLPGWPEQPATRGATGRRAPQEVSSDWAASGRSAGTC